MKKLIILVVLIFSLFSVMVYKQVLNRTEDTITVSGGVTSESQILGNMIVELIRHETKYKVKLLNNLASAQINQVAMDRKQLGISSARYTGTDLMTTLGHPIITNPNKALDYVQKEFEVRYNEEWFPSYGFANNFSFMVTKETAQKYHLTKVSDLKKESLNLSFGCDSGWYERDGDGYHAFTQFYDMKFKKVYPMQVGLLYDALNGNKLDVVLGYSTDGRISSYGLVMLEDDYQFFPPYTCSMVVDKELYKKYPNLKKILHRLDGKITTPIMQKLNYESDAKLIEPEVVAKKFLEKYSYFKEGEK